MEIELGLITRQEEIKVVMRFVAEELSSADKRRITRLSACPSAQGKDVITLTYTLDIDYLNNVEQNLKDIIALCKVGAVESVSARELRHGKSVVREVFWHLERLEKLFNKVRKK